MGNFNPHRPNIVGMEWAPIAKRQVAADIFTEWGWSFPVTGSPNQPTSVQALLPKPQPNILNGAVLFYSIYPKGRETDVGQISKIRIPASAVAVTGATGNIGGITVLNDFDYIEFDSTSDRIRVSFDVNDGGNDVRDAIQGKRILGVDLVYQAAGTPGFVLEPTIENFTQTMPYGPAITGPATLDQVIEPDTVRFGEVNPWWNRTDSPFVEEQRMPWRYEELLRFTVGDANRIFVGIRVSDLPLSGIARLGFLALDVYFCEESRVRYGGTALGNVTTTTGLAMQGVSSGYPIIDLRNTSFQVTGSLPPGDYTATIQQADAGDYYNTGTLNFYELTQNEEISTHPAWEIEKFKRPTAILPPFYPQIESTDKMYGFPITNIQTMSVAYIDEVGAPVYLTTTGVSVFALQELRNVAAANDTPYKYVKFYARRFNPSAPGDLTVSVDPAFDYVISAEDFAALPELTVGENGPGTGWKEVIIEHTSTGALVDATGTALNVLFRMTGVATSSPSDQYQILVASVFQQDDLFSSFPSTEAQLTRYDAPQTMRLVWKSLTTAEGSVVTGSSETAVVMLGQAPLPVTGFAITEARQDLETIGRECDGGVDCLPTAIIYNHLEWTPLGVCDSFDRRAADSWGTADTEQTWINSGGLASDYDVTPDAATHLLTTANVRRTSTIDGPIADGDVYVRVKPGVVATGASIWQGAIGRFTDTSNYYLANLQFETTGAVTAQIREFVAGVDASLTSVATGLSYVAASEFMIHFQFYGSLLRMKAWPADMDEPIHWIAAVNDTSFTTGRVGALSIRNTGNTNGAGTTTTFGDFSAAPLGLFDSTVQIQRLDDFDEDWQDVYRAPAICGYQFNDYEARVGVESEYRIRVMNDDEFGSPWVTGAVTLASPGVTTTGDGNSVLIFTSNIGPTGNLAYVMQFGNYPEEEFAFPEAGSNALRQQYRKDFYTAFRPLERGGEVFTRDILVHNAAIPPISLANFRSLRDLAWATLPYVCVRDELGNRWFANVVVPSGRVRSNRTVYIAQIQIAEVTDTPAPVES